MTFQQVHNIQERLVFKHLFEHYPKAESAYLEDLACLTLDKLPPRYVRHDVDFEFYLDSNGRQTLELAVEKAVHEAKQFLDSQEARPSE